MSYAASELTTSLVVNPTFTGEPICTKDMLIETLRKSSLYGCRGLITALHYAGNGFILSSLGGTAAAAGSIIATLQGVTIALCSGFLNATGAELGNVLGARKEGEEIATNQDAAGIIKTSWVMTLLFGTIGIGVLNLSSFLLPLFIEQDVALAATQYLQFFSMAIIPDLLTANNGQIIFQVEGDSKMPFITNASYRLPALALSYCFGKILAFGPIGVALGSVISGWLNVTAFQFWFSKPAYRPYHLYSSEFPHFSKHACKFLESGWKLSLQRITEWGNLAALTQIVGRWSRQGLIALQPSILLINLCGLLSQGFGQASMMIAVRDHKAMLTALSEYKSKRTPHLLGQAKILQEKIRKGFYVNNLAGIAFNLSLAASIYFARRSILGLYIPANTPDSTLELSNTLLWINEISMIPDAARIISGGALRGWDDMLIPIFASLFLMSGLGIGAGIGWGLATDEDITPFFICRAITLVLAMTFNCYRFYEHAREDQNAYEIAITFGQQNQEVSHVSEHSI